MNKIVWNGFCFVATVIVLIIYACANRGMITGGEQDVTPPKITAEKTFAPASLPEELSVRNGCKFRDKF